MTHPSVHELTVADCDRHIEDITERIVALGHERTDLIAELRRWSQRRTDLTIPRPR